MNKVEKEENIESKEERKILNDAENIIEQFSNTNLVVQKKKKRFLIIPILILIVLALFSSTIFAIVNINSNTIISGVFIEGIDVSGLTVDEAKEKVSSALNNQLQNDITINHNDFSATIVASQFNVAYDIDSSIETAYSFGRSSNIFKNNYDIINALSKNVNITPSITYDSELLNSIISSINTSLPDAVVQSSYYIDGTNLIITNGKNGVTVNKDAFCNELLFNFENLNSNPITIDLPVSNTNANPIDIDSIYKEVYKSASDAYYTKDPYAVYPSSTGIDFDISINDAKNMIATAQDTYTIPLKILYPNVTTSQLGTDAFPDLLSDFSTSFTSSNSNRSTNITLAAEKINGVVLMPGETFSYNETVGKRTAAAGFKSAPAYSNGEVVQEIGGGICQVSSTLYNAVLYANLEVTDRSNHCFKPSYVKPGLDATVSWGAPDFKFVNNRNYPIKILCDTSGKILHMYIYGLKTSSDYKIELEADVISTVYPKTVYKTDSSLSSGQSKVIQSPSNGCVTASYKILYDQNGNFVDKILISKDTYNAHNKIIAVGP